MARAVVCESPRAQAGALFAEGISPRLSAALLDAGVLLSLSRIAYRYRVSRHLAAVVLNLGYRVLRKPQQSVTDCHRRSDTVRWH